MTIATTLITLRHICVIGAGALGCVTGAREIHRDRAPTIHSASSPFDLDGSVATRLRRPSDVLTAADLSAVRSLASATAYEAVVQLRPGFLRPRDVRTGAILTGELAPAVFVGGMFAGGPEVLRGITVSAVAEMLYVRSFEAMLRYGPNYGAGVILVRLKR
jgi:hypothetical protein